MNVKTPLIRAGLAAACLLTAVGAQAATWGKSQSAGTCDSQGEPSTFATGNTCTSTDATATATVSAWYSTAPGTNNWAAAMLTGYDGGLGVKNTSGDDHSTDSSGTKKDALLFSFTKSVSLNALTIGWFDTDADISVLAWVGNGSPTSTAGALPATLGGAGWQVIGNFADVHNKSTGNTDTQGFSTSVSSMWWMVAAYNTAFGSTCTDDSSSSGDGCSANTSDYFKLLSVSGTVATTTTTPNPNPTPEPLSLALFAVAGVGAYSVRRRKQQAA